MNSAKLHDWLTHLANVGIIVGLVIVYLELDHANRLAEANAMQARDDGIVQSIKDYALSDYLPDIVIKAQESGFDSLTAVEVSRYREWEQARLQRMVATYRQYEMGFIDRQTIDNNFRVAVARGWFETWNALGVSLTGNSAFWEELRAVREAAKSQR